MSLKRAKNANNTFKNAVFGFIREHEKEQSVMAPTMIKYLILNYYLIEETFTDNGASGVKLTEGNTVAETVPPFIISGNIQVDVTDESISEYIWTLQFITTQSMRIGDNEYWKIGLADGTPGIMFGVMMSLSLSWAMPIVRGHGKQGEKVPTLDRQAKEHVVQMRLNTIVKTLLFVVNGQTACILLGPNGLDAFLQRKSKLCVRFSGGTKMVKLLDFSIKQR